MKPDRAYVAYLQNFDVYVFYKKNLKGCALYIGYGDYGDVLATDLKKGFWYYTLSHHDDKYYYGPFPSAQAARRGFDKHWKFENE